MSLTIAGTSSAAARRSVYVAPPAVSCSGTGTGPRMTSPSGGHAKVHTTRWKRQPEHSDALAAGAALAPTTSAKTAQVFVDRRQALGLLRNGRHERPRARRHRVAGARGRAPGRRAW